MMTLASSVSKASSLLTNLLSSFTIVIGLSYRPQDTVAKVHVPSVKCFTEFILAVIFVSVKLTDESWFTNGWNIVKLLGQFVLGTQRLQVILHERSEQSERSEVKGIRKGIKFFCPSVYGWEGVHLSVCLSVSVCVCLSRLTSWITFDAMKGSWFVLSF